MLMASLARTVASPVAQMHTLRPLQVVLAHLLYCSHSVFM